MRIYIHIPFCESKCKYCRFASIWNLNTKLIDKYVNHLVDDIKNIKRPVLKKTGLKLSSIYFWWWTPWVLTQKQLSIILDAIKKVFIIDKNTEITLETTPENLTSQKLLSLEQLWINRVSFWIQTLNNKALKEIKRQGRDSIILWLENLKKSSIKNISVDFIIWLPYVKKNELLSDIKYIIKNYSFIKHISVYMLEDYYDTNTDDKLYDKITYPSNWRDICLSWDDIVDEYISISNYLDSVWYKRYELSNFSKVWFECVHNKWYWNHDEVIAFWLWAHWFLDNHRYAFSSDFIKYYAWVYEYVEKLDKKDILLEKIMFMLRTNWLDSETISQLEMDKVNNMINKWYLSYSWDRLIVTDLWIWLIDFIIWEIY